MIDCWPPSGYEALFIDNNKSTGLHKQQQQYPQRHGGRRHVRATDLDRAEVDAAEAQPLPRNHFPDEAMEDALQRLQPATDASKLKGAGETQGHSSAHSRVQ